MQVVHFDYIIFYNLFKVSLANLNISFMGQETYLCCSHLIFFSYVAQTGLKLTIFLTQPPECWDYKCVSQKAEWFIYSVVVGIESGTLSMLGKHPTTELHPQLFDSFESVCSTNS
jgi:hypothetical protein